jgi:hypothetical protein
MPRQCLGRRITRISHASNARASAPMRRVERIRLSPMPLKTDTQGVDAKHFQEAPKANPKVSDTAEAIGRCTLRASASRLLRGFNTEPGFTP